MSAIPESTAGARVPIIDARAPRFNQAVIGLAALAAVIFHAWVMAALAALQLGLSLTLGARACLACLVYFRVLRPRLGPGPVEDARPVRFANLLGLVFLSAAALAHLGGHHAAERGLALTVASLALLAASTGFCLGCRTYRLWAALRGIRRARFGRIDLDEIGAEQAPGLVVQFTHPRCTDCVALEARLREQGTPLALVDVSTRADLARKYGVSVVPLAFRVAADGRIIERVGVPGGA